VPHDRNWRERGDERLVRWAVTLNASASRLLRPGSFVVFVAASLFAVGALLKEADVPSKSVWRPGSPALDALLVVGAVTYLGYVGVIWGYLRTLKTRDQEGQLYRACRDVAALVEKGTNLNRDSIGVHVWVVRGLIGVRRLERRATFVPWDRPPTAVVWRKGKGAIGRCWALGEWVLADVEELQRLAPTEHAFYAIPPEDRFFFTWPEFFRDNALQSNPCVALAWRTAGRSPGCRLPLHRRPASRGSKGTRPVPWKSQGSLR
jgi:hypothetical protein